MNRIVRLFHALLVLTPMIASSQQTQYSAENPPPVSFLFAGPLAQPIDGGGMEMKFRFSLAVHSLEPDRIEIIDMTVDAD